MLLVGVGVVWAGYVLTYFGKLSLDGPGVGLLDLMLPGRFKGFPPKSIGSTPAARGESGFGSGGAAGGGGGGGGGGSF